MVNYKEIRLHSGLQNFVERTPNVARYYIDVAHRRKKRGFKDETMMLLRDYQSASPEEKVIIRNKIVELNLGLVISLAKEYCTENDEFMDLVEEGNIGLLEAVEKYDITRESCFTKVALFYIRKEINNYKLGDGNLISQKSKARTIFFTKRLNNRMVQEVERTPTPEEVMERFNEDSKIKKCTKEDFVDVVYKSIDNMSGVDGNLSKDLSELIKFNSVSCSQNDYEATIDKEHTKQLVRQYISLLPQNEQTVVKLFYGLDEAKIEHGYNTIAAKLNLTDTRINQIHLSALNRLKKKLLPEYNLKT